MITFGIPGPPQGKGRPKFGKGIVYTPIKTVSYESLIKVQAFNAMKGKNIYHCAVKVAMMIYMPVPGSWSKKKQTLALEHYLVPTVKPDLDNVVKVVFDAINNIVWDDDKQVAMLNVSKYYDKSPQIQITIMEIVT